MIIFYNQIFNWARLDIISSGICLKIFIFLYSLNFKVYKLRHNAMSLKKYRAKRDLTRSTEPPAKKHKRKGRQLHFVVQKHDASRLHYDFRLEADGVLKSWAVPKGPSVNPKDKRLAIHVEDHPFEYRNFEGIIPEGYGAGNVIIWDAGTYDVEEKTADESEKEILKGLEKGEIHFSLHGEKLHGEYTLVRINREKDEWLLIKKKDAFASSTNILELDQSIVSGLRVDELEGSARQKKSSPPQAKGTSGRMPKNIRPMLATLIDAPFTSEDWIFEIKWDGYRALAEIDHKKVKLYSRNEQPFNDRFPEIVEHLKHLDIQAVFDGEIVALDKKGIPRFQLMQNALTEKDRNNIYYYVFDLLYFDGKDVRGLPLIERKELLRKILAPFEDSLIRYTEHIGTEGEAFFEASVKNDLEGIIAKRKESHYIEGKRSQDWAKIKRLFRQEVIICGFTEPKGERKNIGALITGIYRGKTLTFCGHVGGGFTEKKLKEVKKLLEPLIQEKCPFKPVPKTKTSATWVKPLLLCEVEFSEWTSDGMMRQPIFLGIRADKNPVTVVEEHPEKKEKVLKRKDETSASFSNLDKVFWPAEKFTKGDVIDYYRQISKFILPHLKDRPQSLKRFPNGIEEPSFFQKNVEKVPDWIETVKIPHKDKIVNYLLIQNKESLLYAANLGCIELHPFFSRVQSLNFPDFIVFDLDPEEVTFDAVVEVALAAYDTLEELGCKSYCKTSGATGLHICVPLGAKYTYEQAKQFAQIIALITHKKTLRISSLERSPQKRKKKVYIDYLQNNPGQTIAAPYSLRARPKAPVSTPLEWHEVKNGLDPNDFTMMNILKRLQDKGDLFKPVLKKGISIESVLKKLELYT